MRLPRVPLMVAVVVAGLWSQTTDKPLTNSAIESMLVAGLPESTILLKIQTAAFRGLVDLDTSSAALIALKQRGATEQVLNAVMWAEPFGAELKRRQEEDRAAPGLPGSSGAYYKAASGWVSMRSFLFWRPFDLDSSLYSGRGREYHVSLGGSHGDLQLGERQPTFYLREPASRSWRLIRLGSRDNQRLLRLTSSGALAAIDRFAARDTREVQITLVAGEVFTLRPVAPLEAGEYALCSAVPVAANLNVCYGFGVQH